MAIEETTLSNGTMASQEFYLSLEGHRPAVLRAWFPAPCARLTSLLKRVRCVTGDVYVKATHGAGPNSGRTTLRVYRILATYLGTLAVNPNMKIRGIENYVATTNLFRDDTAAE